MNPRLAILQRQMERRTPERIPAPSGGIGAAIEQLIANEVTSRVAETLEKQTPPKKVRELFNAPAPYTDYRQLPPVQKPQTRVPCSGKFYRDGAGQLLWFEGTRADGSTVKTKVVRDGAGMMIGFEEIEESPVLPPLEIDYKPKAREYNPGEPR